jgi:hypothetical protein
MVYGFELTTASCHDSNLLFLSHILLLELGIAGCSGLEQRLTEAEVAWARDVLLLNRDA